MIVNVPQVVLYLEAILLSIFQPDVTEMFDLAHLTTFVLVVQCGWSGHIPEIRGGRTCVP